MPAMSEALREALKSDCGHSLEPVVAERNPQDFQALLVVVERPSQMDDRLKALHLLGRWGDQRAVPVISRLLPELTALERCRAIDALGRLGGAEAQAVVLEHADDPSTQVRKFAVHALTRLDTPKAREVLQRMKRDDPAEFVRRTVP
jgi:HEAT repeat protein